MARQFKRLSIVLATTSLAFGGALVVGPAAQADTQHCSDSGPLLLELDTSGENIDIEYSFCVDKSEGGKFRGHGYGNVTDGGGQRKVDAFKVESRLEKGDRTVTKRTCDFTNEVNSSDGVNTDCESPWKAASGSHTGDGRVYVDIDSDGAGGKWYGVPGSAGLS